MFLLHDMLSRIQNAINLRRRFVSVQRSKYCVKVLKVLYDEGLIENFFVSSSSKEIVVCSKYYENKAVFKKFKLISKINRRVFVSARTIFNKIDNYSLFVLSTNKFGIISSKTLLKYANQITTGGEILFRVIF